MQLILRSGNLVDMQKEFGGQDATELGRALHAFATELYPLCRSITGNGIRQTLSMVGERIPLKITEVPTGASVFDWQVPKEWNIQDAYIKTPSGERIVDSKNPICM